MVIYIFRQIGENTMSFPIPQNARGFNHQSGWKIDDIKYNPKQKRILEGKFQ